MVWLENKERFWYSYLNKIKRVLMKKEEGMKNSSYNLNFEKLCNNLSLGRLKDSPQKVFGGLMNKMYRIETDKGDYAVKAVNPQIMERNTAMENYIFSEKVAKIAFNMGINAIPAIEINGDSIHEIDGQYYLVFPWFDGKALEQNTIAINKCKIIGGLLAEIHNIDFSSIPSAHTNTFTTEDTDWKIYIEKAKTEKIIWYDDFSESIDRLYEIERRANKGTEKISKNLVISHRDLDPKNVLWDKEGTPMIIDWEAAGTVNPSLELVEDALYWSGGEKNPNREAFCAFIKSYIKNGGIINDNLKDVLDSVFKGKLEWLKYNIRRSLRIECSSDEEQILGTKEVIETLQSILDYEKLIPVLLEWLDVEEKVVKTIDEYYEGYDEETRLIKDNAHKTEFITTTYFLDKRIKDKVKILEVGAGTGRYSFYYAKRGHDVTAMDIVDKNIETMKQKLESIDYKSNINIEKGDARDLSKYDDNSFDVVLCLGPLYHLTRHEDRVRCIEECLRVLKRGGTLAIAYINRYAAYAVHIGRDKKYINDDGMKNIYKHGLEYGDDRDCFYYTTYKEIEGLMDGFKVRKINHIGTDGIVHMIRDNINSLDEDEFDKWLEYHLMTCEYSSIIGYSLHGLYLCRKYRQYIEP